jgi:hypothetical protein
MRTTPPPLLRTASQPHHAMPHRPLLLLLNVTRAYVLALHPPDAASLSAAIVAHGLAPHAIVLQAVNGSEVLATLASDGRKRG